MLVRMINNQHVVDLLDEDFQANAVVSERKSVDEAAVFVGF